MRQLLFGIVCIFGVIDVIIGFDVEIMLAHNKFSQE